MLRRLRDRVAAGADEGRAARPEGSVDPKLLGTTERDDGTTQATYDGRPLYYYVDDPPGEALCHNVFEFGGLGWSWARTARRSRRGPGSRRAHPAA